MSTLLGRLSRRLGGPDFRQSTPPAPLGAHRCSPSTSPRRATWASAEQHAQLLVHWLREHDLTDGSILSADLRHAHDVMCAELGVLQRGYNRVAREYALLTSGGVKLYAPTDGGRRLRVHALPASNAEVAAVGRSLRQVA